MIRNKNKFYSPLGLIIFICLVSLVIMLLFFIKGSNYNSYISFTNIPNIQDDETFLTARITDYDDSCFHDGVCKLKVINYWIITDLGGDPTIKMVQSRGIRGRLINEKGLVVGNFGSDVINKQVEVFAKVVDDSTLTLYGSGNYYIKFKE